MIPVIVLAHNGLRYTKQCLESVVKHTETEHELIIVNNGSTDGTTDFLKGIGHKQIHLSKNAGFAGGINAGLQYAFASPKVDMAVCLNNDLLVGPGWLRRLVKVAEGRGNIGMVGPVTNNCKGQQKVSGPRLGKLTYVELEEFAVEHAHRYENRWSNAPVINTDGIHYPFLSMFAFLLTRTAWEFVGPLDEQFGHGNWEDDDYCVRLLKAGFRLVIVGDVFIYHHGQTCYHGELGYVGPKWTALIEENKRKFVEKWKDEKT